MANFAPGGYAGLDASKKLFLENIPMASATDVAAGTATDKLVSVADVKTMIDDQTIDAYTKAETDALLDNKVDKEAGKGLSTNDYTTDEKTKLAGLENETAATIKTKYESNPDTNAFTDAEKAKLAGLEGPNWKGEFTSLAALEAAYPVGEPGWNADVDSGVGQPVVRYIWDSTDNAWTPQTGTSTEETAESIKFKYEFNPDTNAFTDAEKAKLAGIDNNAEENQFAYSTVQIGSQAGAPAIMADAKQAKFILDTDTSMEIVTSGSDKLVFSNKDANFEQRGVLMTMSNLDINSMTINELLNIKDRIMTPETVVQLVYRIVSGGDLIVSGNPDTPTP